MRTRSDCQPELQQNYSDISGIIPPVLGGLHINRSRLHLLNQFLGAIGQSCGGVGGTE